LQQASAAQPRAAQTRNELFHIAERAEKLLTAIIGASADARGALRGQLDNLPVDKILSGAEPSILATLMPPAPQRDADNVLAGALEVSQGLGMPRYHALKLLCVQLSAVERLRFWFENAARLLPAEVPGAHKTARNRRWLVGELDTIQARYTGRHVSRSYKVRHLLRYVQLCFAAADPNVGPGSITKAIEAYARLNPGRRTGRAQNRRKKRA
jgi:hypothetical protein